MATLPLETMKLSADAIRVLSMDGVQRANSGHPGTPMGLADLSVVLWSQHLKHAPLRPDWVDRDRFILSCGHASMLIYSLLHLSGYDLSMEDLKQFRQWGSKTPGHPEWGHTAGVEMTTGPLGQGISTAVGFALGERNLAARFNRHGYDIVNHRTWVIASDGDIQEGISHETASMAGHLGLHKLTVFYDDNNIQIDGTVDSVMTEDVAARYTAYGWHVQTIEDGHDLVAIDSAIRMANRINNKPSLIIIKSHIGYGSPNKQDTSGAHGAPFGEDEIALTKQSLGWTLDPWEIPDAVYELMNDTTDAAVWDKLFADYADAYPELAAEFKRVNAGELPENWHDALPVFEAGSKIATRNASGNVLKKLIPVIPEMLGGSADLTGSVKTWTPEMVDITRDSYGGRYLRYGVREHGMGAIMNGLSLHGGNRPYAGTFLVFSDYMKGAIRLSAIMNQPVIYILTHDSIGLGEDGPTHQPIEHLAALRATPNVWVIRPADANETSVAWQIAMERKDGPTCLVLTRQNLPTVEQDTSSALQGGYVLNDAENAEAILLATGSEVEIIIEAQKLLAEQGISARVVSLPCWELFDQQTDSYKTAVLPSHITNRVAIEAASTMGWAKYTGTNGTVIGLDHFGGSAPYQELYEKFGLTAQAVVDAVLANR